MFAGDPGSEASQGDKVGKSVTKVDRSDVQMCLSMIMTWTAMHTVFLFPYPCVCRCTHVETVDRPTTYLFNKFAWTLVSLKSTIFINTRPL